MRPLHFVHAGPGQTRDDMQRWVKEEKFAGQGSSGDCLGHCWEGNSVWQDNGQDEQNMLQSFYPPV